jgi:holo-[acyl-carrier protein] synthase
MIVGTGIDIAEVPRIRQAMERFGDRFVRRIYTAGEIRYCDSKANRVERYAARFAAKADGRPCCFTARRRRLRQSWE